MKFIKTFAVLLFGFTLVIGVTVPGTAITDGHLDGNLHPEVVLIIMDIGGIPAYRCSGTLIAPTFVLTAGHCAGEPGEFSGLRIFTESDVQNGDNTYPWGGGPNSIEAVRFASHPLYTSAGFFLHDVGMLELEHPYVLDHYGQLPGLDQLDQLHSGSRQTEFTSVGYGLQQVNAAFATGLKIRMYANPFLIQINTPGFTGDFSMLLSNNANTGGTCFGDSGGPNFLGDSMVVAGVTSYGLNGACGGTGGVFRMDRGNVLDFVNGFMSA